MAIIKKTLFADNLDKYNTFVTDTDPSSKYFKLTELPDTFTGGKNAFLIQGSEYLVPDSLIKIELKDAKGNIVYHEPGEGIVSSSVNGFPIVTEYYEGVSKLVSVYIYPETAYGPCTITILGELSSYNENGVDTPIPANWEGIYNVKWQKQINVVPSLANTTKIRFYKRPTAKISEILSPIYSIVGNTKVASAVTQSFASIKLSNLETFAGDVKRVKVFRTSIGDISDYDLIQDILVESKELLTSYGLSGSVVGNTGIFTSEVLKNQWNSGSLTAILDSSKVEAGVKLTGNGLFTYTQSLNLISTNTYELNLDAFYSSSTNSNLGIYLVSGSISSSIATLLGIQPTKNLLDTVIPFQVDRDYPTASLYFSQSQGEWHVGNVSLRLSQDTAFSPDEIGFITTMPTVLGNETFNFKFEFYDINNNYVPVAVTQSALFNGGNTNIGGTILLISSSASSSAADLSRVSSSISGTVTFNSSSTNTTIVTLSGSVSSSITVVSGSVVTLSGSVSGSITSLSSSVSGTIGILSGSVSASITALSASVSQSVYQGLLPAFARVQRLADGNFSGSFIGDNIIYSPVIGGQLGYFSTLFKVGQSPNSIYLDARQTPRKIFIGGAIPGGGDTEYSGAFNNTNTNVYLDSSGKFSLGNKLSYDGSNLAVNGTITITNPSTANNGGKVGGFSNGDALTGGSIAGVTIASTKIYIGTGTFANANTAFYVDNTGQFSLKDKLYWNGTTLNIEGNIVITGGSTKTSIDNAAAAASTAQSTADSKITGGQVNANVTSISGGSITTGTISANRIDVSGVISAGSIIVAGNNISSLTNNSGFQDASNVNSATKTSGFVGGWTINSNSIFSGTEDYSGYTTSGITLYSGGSIHSKNFYIDTSGNAFFKGDITGASGTFSGNLSGATITGATGTFSGDITGASGTFSGNLSGANITGATGTFAGSITGASGTFSGVTINSSGITFGNFRLGSSGITFVSYNYNSEVQDYSMFCKRLRLYKNNSQNGPQQGSYENVSLQFDYLTEVTSGTVSLQVDTLGNVYKAGSTRRIKKNIEDTTLDDAKRILNLNVRSFNGLRQNDGDEKAIGLIAEEVYDLGYNDLVVMGQSGSIDSVEYQSVFVSMVKVVQDLNKRIEELEAKISGSV